MQLLNSVDRDAGLFFALFQPCCVGRWLLLVSQKPMVIATLGSEVKNAFQDERREKVAGIF